MNKVIKILIILLLIALYGACSFRVGYAWRTMQIKPLTYSLPAPIDTIHRSYINQEGLNCVSVYRLALNACSSYQLVVK